MNVIKDQDKAVQVSVTIGHRHIDYKSFKTDAPKVYDGFGTFTLIEDVALDPGARDPEGRLVLIDEEHLEWQLLRYRSGGYSIQIETMVDTVDLTERLWDRLNPH